MATTEKQTLYHEQQTLQQCLKHTLNNILQRSEYTIALLNQIADELEPDRHLLFKRHRTLVVGNYDVNVLDLALQKINMQLHWHDIRDTEFQTLPMNNFAIICNVATPGPLGLGLLPGRHWFGIKKIDDVWYNLDSKLKQPTRIVTEEEDKLSAPKQEDTDDAAVRNMLKTLVEQEKAQIFYVTTA